MKRSKHAIEQPNSPVAGDSKQQNVAVDDQANQLQAALALHQQGQLDQAETIYKAILQSQPQHFDALQLLATVALQRNDLLAAVELFDRALKIFPHPITFNNRGNALLDLKRPEQALDSYDQALAINPDFAEALNNRGVALFNLKRPEQALGSYERALAIRPDYAEALNNCGNVLRDLKRYEDALACYERALAIKPDYAEALNNCGNVLLDLKRPEQALDSYNMALAIKPDYPEALNSCGNVLHYLKYFEEALNCDDHKLAIKTGLCGNTRTTAATRCSN